MALLFSGSGRTRQLSRDAAAGRIRRLTQGVYTDELQAEPARVARLAWLEIVAHFFPGALIADRSARSATPDQHGDLFVVHTRRSPLRMPGLTVVPRQGQPPLPDDVKLPANLWLASRPRALVENLLPSRRVKGRAPRTLTTAELHDWVVQLHRTDGAERLNHDRDRARAIAELLGLAPEFSRLDDIIGAVLGTRTVETASPALAAAQKGHAFDDRRDVMFQKLSGHLQALAPVSRPASDASASRGAMLPFFEAYFSNFIEGTEFTVQEAKEIVFDKVMPPLRPADAHDVLGTYAIVSSPAEASRTPSTSDELIAQLEQRNAQVLSARPELRPGQLKDRANRAGTTEFVAPALVRGTLMRGFEHLQQLRDPFARAVFMMFLVSEVHPFNDGNGRVARIMMNAELTAAGEQRIIIPPVYRNEYLGSLRNMSRDANPNRLTRVLDFAQKYTAQVDFSTLESALAILTRTNALADPAEADERGLRLMLPAAL
jgi:hypothetical protein